jgi:DNA-binding transcriptional regulator YiaG
VDPSDIRQLRKCYGIDMAQHENNFGVNSERVQKWKSALVEVSHLSGKAYTTGYVIISKDFYLHYSIITKF